MRFELAHAPLPDGYGAAILSLEACKAHLSIAAEETEFDALIEALRDAAIEYVERYCGVKLGPVDGMTWRAESLPCSAQDWVDLAARPVTGLTSVTWLDSTGAEVAGDVADFRFSEKGVLRPAVGAQWPSGIGGEVVITFSAGFAEGEAPPALLSAVRLMLGHLFAHREAVLAGAVAGEAPLGVAALCAPFRPVVI